MNKKVNTPGRDRFRDPALARRRVKIDAAQSRGYRPLACVSWSSEVNSKRADCSDQLSHEATPAVLAALAFIEALTEGRHNTRPG
jgi:hypothetical protein